MRGRLVTGVACLALACQVPGAARAQMFKRNTISDPCAVPSSELQKSKGGLVKSVAGKAAIGALLGVGAAYLTTDNAKRKDLIKGAVAGGLIGAATGYVQAKMQQNEDVKALAGSVYQDVASNNVEAARALRTFTEARACRVAEAANIKAAFGRGALDRETAQKRLEDQRARLQKDILAAQQFLSGYDKAMDDFEGAAGYLAADSVQDKAYVARLSAAKSEALAVQTAPPLPTAPPRYVLAPKMVNVRTQPAGDAAKVATLAAGQTAELVEEAAAPGGWHKVKTAGDAVGYVLASLTKIQDKPAAALAKATRAPAPPPPQVVSADVKMVGEPLFEGVEKRKAMASQIQLAKKDATDATFELE